MKKIVFALLVAVVAMPALAQEAKQMPVHNAPAMEMQRDHEAFEKAHKEQRAQFKATQEKMEKLVKEYNKLKGKKKDAKRAEIEQEIGAIHEKQLEFRKAQLAQFEERLNRMKAEFAQENTAENKAQWVTQKTDALIAADGNMKALFPRPKRRGADMDRPHRGFGHKGFGPRGPQEEVED